MNIPLFQSFLMCMYIFIIVIICSKVVTSHALSSWTTQRWCSTWASMSIVFTLKSYVLPFTPIQQTKHASHLSGNFCLFTQNNAQHTISQVLINLHAVVYISLYHVLQHLSFYLYSTTKLCPFVNMKLSFEINHECISNVSSLLTKYPEGNYYFITSVNWFHFFHPIHVPRYFTLPASASASLTIHASKRA